MISCVSVIGKTKMVYYNNLERFNARKHLRKIKRWIQVADINS